MTSRSRLASSKLTAATTGQKPSVSFSKTTIALACGACMSQLVWAQPSIEEVVVTAERREANLQDVPLAVSSFSPDDLKAQQVSNIGDLQSLVPNLSVHVGDANNAVVYIRGIGQIDSIAFFEPGVGIYLDDVYLGRAQGAFLDVVDVERIEVLRGPQGSLYGRNTVGGAIKYVSAAPTDEFSGSISATLGNFDRREMKAVVSGPLSDTVKGRLTLAKMTREGYSENTFDGNDDGDRDVSFARGVLQWQPSDSVDVQFAVDYSDGDPSHSRTPAKVSPITVPIVDPYTFAVSAQTFAADQDPFKVNADFNNTEFTTTKGAGLNVSWDLSEHWTLKSISSFRKMEYGTEIDLDGTPLPAFGIFYFNEQEQSSQELQLSYQSEKLSLVSGLYYFNEQGDTYDGGVFANFLIAMAGEAQFETDSLAAFGQLDYELNEKTTLTAGFRYTEEDKRYSRQVEDFQLTTLAGMQVDPTSGAISYQNPELLNPSSADLHLGGVGVARAEARPDEASFDNFSPKLGIKYQLSDDSQVYASASSSFKSGGFNGRAADGQLEPYDEESLRSYEIGMKTQLWDNRLRINSALFYNDYDDLQLSSFAATQDGNGILPIFTNAGKAVMKGVELEVTALLTEQFSLNVNVGYLDAEYREYIIADPVTKQTSDVSEQREMANAPQWDAFLGLRYDWPLGDIGQLSVLADVSYRSKTYLEVNSSENLAQAGYSVSNLAVMLETNDEQWQVVLGAKNLGDKEYRTHAFDLRGFPGVELGYYNPPRTYSLSASYQF